MTVRTPSRTLLGLCPKPRSGCFEKHPNTPKLSIFGSLEKDMKYLTKEYYALIDASVLAVDLIAAPSAKRKSENYFQHLYAERQQAWLDMAKDRAERKGLPFDEAAELEAFKLNYQKNLRDYSTKLPADILSQVADIRILALGSCSSKVKQLLGKFCKAQGDMADSMVAAYANYWEKRYRHFPEHILENFGFDYCTVTAIGRDGDSIIMKLDNSQSNDDVNTVIWKNAELLELEDGVVGGYWMNHELYQLPDHGGYEFHAILEDEGGEMVYLTVKAEDVAFIFDEKKKEDIIEI